MQKLVIKNIFDWKLSLSLIVHAYTILGPYLTYIQIYMVKVSSTLFIFKF